MLNGHRREEVIQQSGKTDPFNQNLAKREIHFRIPFKVKSFHLFIVWTRTPFNIAIQLLHVTLFHFCRRNLSKGFYRFGSIKYEFKDLKNSKRTKLLARNSISDNFVKLFTLKFYVRNIHAPFMYNLRYEQMDEWNKTRLNFKHENYRMLSQLKNLRVLMKMKKTRVDKTNQSSIRWRIWYRSRLLTVVVRWVRNFKPGAGFNKKSNFKCNHA